MNTTLDKIKTTIKVCLLAHKIRTEKNRIINNRDMMNRINYQYHNGRMEVDDVLRPYEKDSKRKIFRYKKEMVKGLQKK